MKSSMTKPSHEGMIIKHLSTNKQVRDSPDPDSYQDWAGYLNIKKQR